MKKVEKTIRDYLASDLSFISSDLHLIEKEFKLIHLAEEKWKDTKRRVKAKGYIDILAQDDEGHYVIIEIKRSNKTARETFNEIFTYIQLLERDHQVKASEIRVILVSSEWNGLLLPFSEMYHRRTYYLEGIEITLDENNNPIDKRLVEPLNVPLSRNISPAHICFLSLTEDGIEQVISSVRKKMLDLGIYDFLIVKMVTQLVPPVVYPFCAYLVHQRYPKDVYMKILKRHSAIDEEDLEYMENVEESEEGIFLWLEQKVMSLLTAEIISDDIEIGYPKKFLAVMASEKWEIARINKEGFFKRDIRLTEKMIVTEIIGLQGSSDIGYVGSANAKDYPRVREIEDNACNSLKFNAEWRQHIEYAFASLRKKPQDFKSMHVEIYCPQMILETLFYACGDLDNQEKFYRHLPMYVVSIDFGEEECLYCGRIKWSGSTCSFNKVIKDVFRTPSLYLSHHYTGSLAEFDPKVMHLLGLEYTTDLQVKRRGKTEVYKDIHISEGRMHPAPRPPSLYLEDFIVKAIPFMTELIQFYYSHFVWLGEANHDTP